MTAAMDASPSLVAPLSGVLRPRRLAGLVGLFVGLGFLAGMAHAGLLTVDGPVSEWVRGDALAGEFGIITTVGGTGVAVGLSMVLAALLWFRCRILALVYPATLAVGALLNIGLKALVGRPRPPAPETAVALASFPSGHTLQATLLFGLLPLAALVVSRRQTLYSVTKLLAVGGIAAVGVSRIYLGAHWPTDVLGAVLVGMTLVVGAEHILDALHSTSRCRCAMTSHR